MHLHRIILCALLLLLAFEGGKAFPDGDMLPQDRYELRMAFGPVVLGGEQRVREELALRPGANERDPFVIIQYPDPPFAVEPLPGQRGDTIPVDRRRVEIGARFTPTRVGEWRDSIVLVRYTPFDRIVVRLYGIGVSATRSTRIDYGDVLTGDTVRRVVAVPREIAELPRTTWRFEGPPPPFFASVTSRPVRIGTSDTMGFVVAYAPATPGINTASMRMVRLRDDGVLLDTIEVGLRGNALRMPSSVNIDVPDVAAGDTYLETAVVELPVAPKRNYAYEIEASTTGPVQGSITDPVGTSPTQRVTLRFACSPRDSGSYGRSFLLRRLRNGLTIDSTILVVSGRATTPPAPTVRLRLGFADTTAQVRIGDTVGVPVVFTLASTDAEPTVRVAAARFSVRYNPSVLVPVETATTRIAERRVRQDHQEVDVATVWQTPVVYGTPDTLVMLRFVAVLGDDDRSNVTLTGATIDVQPVVEGPVIAQELPPSDLQDATTTVLLSNVWRNTAGQRRANTLQGDLDIIIEPNPIQDVATLRLVNVPSNAGHFVIVDEMGRLVADLTDPMRAGQTSFSIGRTQQSTVVVDPGTYYARLVVQDIDGHSLHSAVRLIVVP